MNDLWLDENSDTYINDVDWLMNVEGLATIGGELPMVVQTARQQTPGEVAAWAAGVLVVRCPADVIQDADDCRGSIQGVEAPFWPPIAGDEREAIAAALFSWASRCRPWHVIETGARLLTVDDYEAHGLAVAMVDGKIILNGFYD